MRIVSVEIENFRAIGHRRFEFVDSLGRPRQVTVLAGPNGSGKTSLLYAIANALRGVMGYRTADVPPPSRDDLRLPLQSSSWSDRPPAVHVDVQLEFDAAEQRVIPQVLANLHKAEPPPLENGRLSIHWDYPPTSDRTSGKPRPWWHADVSPSKPHIRSWLSAVSWAIQAWNRRVPGVSYEMIRQMGGFRFFPQDRNLRQRVLGGELGPESVREAEIAGISEDRDEDESSRMQTRRERSIAEILHYFSDYARNRPTPLPDEQNFEKRVQGLFARICAPKQYLGYLYREDNPMGSPVFQDGDRQYPLSHAASGEQVIIEYLVRLTYPSPMSRGIVLIDEPEIHLHPAWVRQVYLALPAIGEQNQFILTTHSAELRQRAVADGTLFDLGQLGNSQ